MNAANPPSRRVPYVNLAAQFEEEREELMAAVEGVFKGGQFIGGAPVDKLEAELAARLGVPHVIALASGTDALILSMKALNIGPGDEVITPPNSFVASTAAITAVGAIPVFADVRDDQNIDPVALAAAITTKTKAIMPVHLTGRVAEMHPIMALAEKYSLYVIEDAAQSIGSAYDGRQAGTIGTVGCFSAHPLKNLNAAGDAGFLATRDDEIARRVRLMRNHGLADRNSVVEWGTVSRLDTLQAAILRIRLSRLDSVIERRRRNAGLYREALRGLPVFIPEDRNIEFNTFHTFVVQVDRRDELQAHLLDRGIETAIHYPVPIHLQPAAAGLGYKAGDFPVTEKQAGRILTLPVNQYLVPDDIAYIAKEIAEFYK